MVSTHPSRRYSLALFLFLLLTLALTSCRSPDPSTEHKDKTGKSSSSAPATPGPPASEPISIEPIVVFEEPDTPTYEGDLHIAPAQITDRKETYPEEKKKPRIAIIIDDMGYHQHIGDQLLQLDLDLTYSFLPDAPFTKEQEQKAFQKGSDILIHLPMEPKNAEWDPGPNALYVHDAPDTIRQKMQLMVLAVPHAIGANNHMGSQYTEGFDAMLVVIGRLKEQSLFFVDSYTSAKSRGFAAAQQLGVPTARRDVFLDNAQDTKKICRQIEQLVSIAKKRGWALGIGHPNRATLLALTQCKKQILKEADVVGVRQLVK